MDLETFVSSTLIQLARGVAAAQQELAAVGALVNPAAASLATPDSPDSYIIKDATGLERFVRAVEFDVAVTVAEGCAADAAAGLQVLGAKIGARGKSQPESGTVSRVRFVVPLALPIVASEPERARRRELDQPLKDRY